MSIRTELKSRQVERPPPDGPMEEREIAAFLERKIDSALNREDGELSRTRERMFNLFRMGPIGEEDANFSTFRTSEVHEMIQEALPALLAIFFSAKSPVVFKAVNPDDVKAAAQHTAIIDHYIFRRPRSFMAFQTWFHSALQDMVAYMKVHCTQKVETVHHEYRQLTAAQLAETVANRQWKEETVEVEEFIEDGEPFFSFSGTEICADPDFLTDPVPPEQLLVDKNAVDLDLDEVFARYGFICHRQEFTRTELIRMGVDPDVLEEIGAQEYEVRFNDERTNRHHREDENASQVPEHDFSTRPYTVYECYVKMDIEGTGMAESYRIMMCGNRLLEPPELISYQPFVAISLIPLPFKHAGMSPAEALEGLQELKTVLIRMMADDGYRNRQNKTHVMKGAKTGETEEQLLDPDGAMVEWKTSPREAVLFEPFMTIIEPLMAFTQYTDEMIKRRSGMAPDVAMNPDVLRDATAHGMLAGLDKSSTRLMQYARLIAETGVAKVGVKLYQLLRMYQHKAKFEEINGEWIEVDPSDWVDRTEMSVSVGLGFNGKEQELQALFQMLQLQREAMAQGMAKPEHLAVTLERMIHGADIGFYNEYFVDPRKEQIEPPPPPPDPQMEAVKVQLQIAQAQEQTKQLEIQAKMQEAANKHEIERMKVKADIERIRADAQVKAVTAEMEGLLLPEAKGAEVAETQAKIAKMEAEIVKLRAETHTILNPPEESESDSQE